MTTRIRPHSGRRSWAGDYDFLSQVDVIPYKWSGTTSAALAFAAPTYHRDAFIDKLWTAHHEWPSIHYGGDWPVRVVWSGRTIDAPEPQPQRLLQLGQTLVFFSAAAESTFRWLTPTIDAVEGLMGLRDPTGRDSPPTADSVLHALTFFSRALPSDAAPPSLAPLNDGGLQAEWHRGGLVVEVIFSPDEEERGIYVLDKSTGEEQEYPLDEAAFAGAVGDRFSLTR